MVLLFECVDDSLIYKCVIRKEGRWSRRGHHIVIYACVMLTGSLNIVQESDKQYAEMGFDEHVRCINQSSLAQQFVCFADSNVEKGI